MGRRRPSSRLHSLRRQADPGSASLTGPPQAPPLSPPASGLTPDLARLVDAQLREFHEDLAWWADLAERCGSPVLELGCGSGRVLLFLARRGHVTHGLERDPQMLERLQANLQAQIEPQITIHSGDLRAFLIPFQFQLILAPCNVLAQLADEDLATCLQAVGRHLSPAGTLAFEVPSPSDAGYAAQPSDEPLSAFTEPQTGNPVQVYAEQVVGVVGGEELVRWRYDELQPDGIVCRHALATRFFLRSPERIAEQLRAAKLGPPAFFGDYQGRPWTKSCPTLLVVSRRSETE